VSIPPVIELLPATMALLEQLQTDLETTLATLCTNGPDIGETLKSAAASTLALYARTKATSPWLSYFARQNNRLVGICAFVAPPANGEVEIAYFTFPPYQRAGIATAMAAALARIAEGHQHCVALTANTLAEENASVHILRRQGFYRAGTITDPDIGLAWHWRKPISKP
jgi:RimJ/RimL family protein N-acetyltransferase